MWSFLWKLKIVKEGHGFETGSDEANEIIS